MTTINPHKSATKTGGWKMKIITGTTALLFTLGSLNTVGAASPSWKDVDGFWTNAANWSTGLVPGPGDDVTMNRPGRTATIDTSVPDTIQFTGINGTLNQTAGNYTSKTSSEFRFGQGGTFTYNITGGS